MSKISPLDTDIDRYSATARAALDVKRPVKRLGELALYTAAAGSALALAPGADASIIYSGIQNVTVLRVSNSTNFAMVDLNGGYDMSFGIDSAGTLPFVANLAVVYAGSDRVQFFDNPNSSMLKFGASTRDIGPTIGANTSLNPFGAMRGHIATASFSTVFGLWDPGRQASSTGFAGFVVGTGSTGNVQSHFGWLHFKLTTDDQNRTDSLTLIDWAYQSVPGEGIHVGDKGISVPEPSGLSLMALGALGIAALRRKRRGEKADRAH